ncbi:sulfite exporter TauE/SafE family protein [Leptolyngbya iicbica]|uniref:Probable membrane transporter protein n=2 Tax=Cyanophyceae TaxID=3028117 RepID=A0A4Q7EIC6_9CYAN|nr:sulfite exporter TauE/SafE family protein [Leptolyngbya sp. LK]RZM82907.1 sulfite exporter TauE/SafE family protein [Leptolyngbya sp. LK]
MTLVLGYLLAIAIGLSLGLIGGGGSVLAVPIMVYVLGVPAKSAIAMSMFVVGCVSLLGVIPHWQRGNVNFKTFMIFTPAAMMGTFLGAKIAGLPWVSDTFQLVAFGIVMVVTSLFMIRKSGAKPRPSSVGAMARHEPHQHHGLLPTWLLIPLEGIVVGIVTGFVGVGGGFLIIPALVLLGGIPMKEAVGTSLLIIAFKSAIGFVEYLNYVTLDWQLMLTFTLAASIGMGAGVYLSRSIDGRHLQKGFGYFVLAVAVFVLLKR